MLACGTASGLVAALWVDAGLDPDRVLDAPPGVLAAVCGVLEGRKRAQAEKERQEDQAAAAQMHAVMGRL